MKLNVITAYYLFFVRLFMQHWGLQHLDKGFTTGAELALGGR